MAAPPYHGWPVASSANNRCSHPRVPRPRACCGGLDLARVGPCPRGVQARHRSLRRRTAPWHRGRRSRRRAGPRAAQRHDRIRGLRSHVRALGHDRHRRRVFGHPRPPRLDRGQAQWDGRGRRAGGDGRPTRRRRPGDAVRAPGRPTHRRSERVPRPAGLPARTAGTGRTARAGRKLRVASCHRPCSRLGSCRRPRAAGRSQAAAAPAAARAGSSDTGRAVSAGARCRGACARTGHSAAAAERDPRCRVCGRLERRAGRGRGAGPAARRDWDRALPPSSGPWPGAAALGPGGRARGSFGRDRGAVRNRRPAGGATRPPLPPPADDDCSGAARALA